MVLEIITFLNVIFVYVHIIDNCVQVMRQHKQYHNIFMSLIIHKLQVNIM